MFAVDVADGQRLSGELHPRFGDILPGAAVGR